MHRQSLVPRCNPSPEKTSPLKLPVQSQKWDSRQQCTVLDLPGKVPLVSVGRITNDRNFIISRLSSPKLNFVEQSYVYEG